MAHSLSLGPCFLRTRADGCGDPSEKSMAAQDSESRPERLVAVAQAASAALRSELESGVATGDRRACMSGFHTAEIARNGRGRSLAANDPSGPTPALLGKRFPPSRECRLTRAQRRFSSVASGSARLDTRASKARAWCCDLAERTCLDVRPQNARWPCSRTYAARTDQPRLRHDLRGRAYAPHVYDMRCLCLPRGLVVHRVAPCLTRWHDFYALCREAFARVA